MGETKRVFRVGDWYSLGERGPVNRDQRRECDGNKMNDLTDSDHIRARVCSTQCGTIGPSASTSPRKMEN